MMNTRALDGANKLWLIIAISSFPMQNHHQVDDDINTKSSGMIWLVLAHRSHTSPDADNPGDDDDSVFAMMIILMVIDDINLSGSYSLGHDDNDDDDFRLVQSWLWHSFPICVVATSPPHCAGGELDHYDCDYDYKSGVQTCHGSLIFQLSLLAKVSFLFLLVKCFVELKARNWDVNQLTCHLCLTKVSLSLYLSFICLFLCCTHNDPGEALRVGRTSRKLPKKLQSPPFEISTPSRRQVPQVEIWFQKNVFFYKSFF